MPPAIRVENLSKRYRISHEGGGDAHGKYKTLRDTIADLAAAPFRRLKNRGESAASAATQEDFFALKDVSFDVQPGEVVGIIGRNGAGKSTLLKILSRITKPTSGKVTLNGRVGSLLEVGTGFHPELTGRENIFLNGSILGMKRGEIQRQFDAIVDFSGVEKFLDTPVKRYSSGMYVRLAFAVAAHLEPEILIIDEVLAVGDAQFQQKCLNKLQSVSREGRTVLFVSHNMAAVLRLCDRAVLLDQGLIALSGDSATVAHKYMLPNSGCFAERTWTKQASPGDKVAKLASVRILNASGDISPEIAVSQPVYIEVDYWNLIGERGTTVSVHLLNEEGLTVFATNDFNNRKWWTSPRKVGRVRATCKIPENFLAEGRFSVLASVCSYNPSIVHAIEPDAVSFQIIDRSDGNGVRGEYTGNWPGIVRPMLDWEVKCVQENTLLP
jgi:lipopolysaccharide transport system ATP-binding protein